MSIPHKQITLNSGWVEHDPEEILANIIKCLHSCEVVDAIGLCHQGESIGVGCGRKRPLYNAIVWQDLRTEKTISMLKEAGLEPLVQSKSGLPLDPYFSASKMGWIIENVVGAKTLADKNKLRIGTMDAFFLDRLCGVFVTDYNSASRTSLLNIHTLEWDQELCDIFGVPIHCLPPIKDNIGDFGAINLDGHLTPVTAIIVDQFAGTFGHGCREKVMPKSPSAQARSCKHLLAPIFHKLITVVYYRHSVGSFPTNPCLWLRWWRIQRSICH